MTTVMSNPGKHHLLRALFIVLVSVVAAANGAFARPVPTYTFVNRKMSFGDADATCASMGGSLASIRTAEEQAAAKAVVAAQQVPPNQWAQRSVWVGLTREGRSGFEWIDGAGTAYTNWGGSEPNNYGGNEQCGVMIDIYQWAWADYPCAQQQAFLCEDVIDRFAPVDPSTVKASIDLYSESDIHVFSLGNYAQVLMSAISRSLTARTIDEMRSMRVTSIFKLESTLLSGAPRRRLAADHAPLASGARFTLEVEMSGPEHAAACDMELMNAVYTGALVERVKA